MTTCRLWAVPTRDPPLGELSVRLAVHGVPAATANHHVKAARVAIERTTRSGTTSSRNPEASGHGASYLGLWLLCSGMVPGGGVGGQSDRGQHSGEYKDRLHCFNLSCSWLSLRWQRSQLAPRSLNKLSSSPGNEAESRELVRSLSLAAQLGTVEPLHLFCHHQPLLRGIFKLPLYVRVVKLRGTFEAFPRTCAIFVGFLLARHAKWSRRREAQVNLQI